MIHVKISAFKIFIKLPSLLETSLLQLSERLPCHIWSIGRTKSASLEAIMDGGRDLFSLPLSGRSPHMTEILLTGTL